MNPENKKQIIILVVLGVVLLGAVIYSLMSGKKPTSTSPTQTASARTGQIAAEPIGLQMVDIKIEELLTGIKVVTFDYERERIERPPMRPLLGIQLGAAPPEPGETDRVTQAVLRKSITSILWNADNPIAIVDNDLVRPGHTYEGGVVVDSIERDRVWFKIGEARIDVKMKEL